MKIAAAAGEKAKLDRQLAEVSDLINRLLAVSHLNATPASCRKLAQQGAQPGRIWIGESIGLTYG